MQNHLRMALGEDGSGDSGAGDAGVVFIDGGVARVMINKDATPAVGKVNLEGVEGDFVDEKVDAGAVFHGLETRLSVAEMYGKVAEAAKESAERQAFHLRSNFHDANNSLTPVMGYIDLVLVRSNITDSVRENLDLALTHVRDLAVLIKLAMNFGRNLKNSTSVGLSTEAISGEPITGLELQILAVEESGKEAESAREFAEVKVLNLRTSANKAKELLLKVITLVELALSDPNIDERTRESLQIASLLAGKVDMLMNRVMDDNGNLELNKVPVALGGLINNALASAKSFLPEGVRVDVDFHKNDNVIVDVDLVNVDGVLLNIVKNAGEALEGASEMSVDPNIKVDFSTVKIGKDNSSEFLRNGEYVKIEISDNGPGVPPNLREEIFEGGVSTKGNKGNGLGLPMVRKIVEAHGGAIFLEATTAEEIAADEKLSGRVPGSKFVIYLPMTKRRLFSVDNKLKN